MAQLAPSDLYVQMFLKSPYLWSRLTSSVLTDQGISITRGRQGESAASAPATCTFGLKNVSGAFSPRYTAGSLFGRIGRNTPIRVGLGNPIKAVLATGTGTTLTLDQISESAPDGALAILAVYHTLTVTDLSTPAGYVGSSETDTASFTYERSRSTGSGAVVATTSTALASASWATAHVAIPGGTFNGAGDGSAQDGASCSVNISDGDLKTYVAVAMWSADVYDRMGAPWFSDQVAPVEMYQVADTGPGTGPRVMVWAWKGMAGQAGQVELKGASDGTTDCCLTVVSYTGVAAYSPRFTGEISEWNPVWDKSEGHWVTQVTAGGALRRVMASQDVVSPLRGAFSDGAGLIAYWPLEDPAGTTSYAAVVGAGNMVPLITAPVAASGGNVAGSLPLPEFNDAALTGPVSGSSPTSWGIGAVVGFGASGFVPIVSPACALARVTLAIDVASSSTQFFINTSGGGFDLLTTAFPNGLANRQALVYMTMTQNGANVDWSVKVTNITPGEPGGSSTITGSEATATLGAITAARVGWYAQLGIVGADPGSIGHVFVTSGTTLTDATGKAEAARGWDGIGLTDAIARVGRDASVKVGYTSHASWDILKAGPVTPGPAAPNLQGLEAAGQGLLADAAGYVGLDYRPYGHSISQASSYTLNYSGQTLTGDLSPVDDDALTLNEATVSGFTGQFTLRRTSGTLGQQAGGVGRYATQVSLPVWTVANAADVAGWLTNLGTLDAARWPELTLEMTATGNALLDLPSFSIGDVISITNLPARTGPTPVAVQVTGFREDIGVALYRLTLNTRMADAWRVLIWDDATYGVWADSAAPTNTDARWGM